MLQKAWYEMSPIIYLIVSIYFLFGENKLAAFCGFVLLIVTLLVVVMRFQYRSTTKARG
jgi:TRAP-type uncharacterized transport system fused permease subunit